MPTSPSRKKLPVNPSLEHLQKQAKRRAKQNPSLLLTAAQHEIAREYGCKNWAELAHVVETMSRGADQLVNVKKEVQPLPKAARKRDLDEIHRILESGQYTPHDLDTALGHALWYGSAENWDVRKTISDLLLEHGADPDGQSGSAYGPIVFGTGECIQPEGLRYLIEAGADVSFAPVKTKYGLHCPMSLILGTYGRWDNERKHRYLDILLQHAPYIPPEVTPPVLAIHRGDATQLGELLTRDPALLHQTFADLPYGNVELRGATLLHCAVEFGEIECAQELLRRGADINARADIIHALGGQTPILHAFASMRDGSFPTLDFLIREAGPKIDLSVRGTFRRHGEPAAQPMTPPEFAERFAPEAVDKIARLRSSATD